MNPKNQRAAPTILHLMLLVVLGAGASYDSLPAFPPRDFDRSNWQHAERRPPLADELFDSRQVHLEAIRSMSQLQPIVPLLRHRHGRSLEQRMQELVGEIGPFPVRRRQLLAVRYYLQYILSGIWRDWEYEIGGLVTNQLSLLDAIDRWRKPNDSVALVTFNYDRLIEEAFGRWGVPMVRLDDYVSRGDYRLFKLHGSINWVRTATVDGRKPTKHAWEDMRQLIEHADSVRMTNDFKVVQQYPTGSVDEDFTVPAIAVPLEKKDTFECPDEHLELLQRLIPEVDRLLVIGWRATEEHFLAMLASRLRGKVPAHLVCGGSDWARDTAQRLQARGIVSTYTASDAGFTEMITRRELDQFLSYAAEA